MIYQKLRIQLSIYWCLVCTTNFCTSSILTFAQMMRGMIFLWLWEQSSLSLWRLLANTEAGGRIVLLLWIKLPCALKERCHSCQRRDTDKSSLHRLAHVIHLSRTHCSYLPLKASVFSVKTQTSQHTVFVKIYIKVLFKLLKC